MASKIKKSKKIIQQKKGVIKEIEIPILIVDNSQKNKEPEIEEVSKNGQDEIFFDQAMQEKHDVGRSKTYAEVSLNFANDNSYELGPEIKFNEFEKEHASGSPIENLPVEKRKILMWTSVAVLTGVIFLSWLFALRYNLSGHSNQSQNSGFFTEIKQSWTEIPRLWEKNIFNSNTNQNNSFKQSSALSEEEINKLKERILEAANAKDNINTNEVTKGQ